MEKPKREGLRNILRKRCVTSNEEKISLFQVSKLAPELGEITIGWRHGFKSAVGEGYRLVAQDDVRPNPENSRTVQNFPRP